MNSENICIILDKTSHPGNIGATARAMKTMGLSNLVLVQPKYFPHQEAIARASKAEDILQNASLYSNQASALVDANYIIGVSSRIRHQRIIALDPKAAATEILSHSKHNKVAILFGNEKSGLDNESLARCHAQIRIPTSPHYSSLNLAGAVQIICYEIKQQCLNDVDNDSTYTSDLAQQSELVKLYEYLHMQLDLTGFFNPQNPTHTQQRLQHIFNRAQLTSNEINLLYGMINSLTKLTSESV